MRELLLGVDIGTSACKVAVFNKQGEVIASGNGGYQVYYPHPGWAEQNPEEWWDARSVSATKDNRYRRQISGRMKLQESELMDRAGRQFAIDKEGNVLTNTPIWMDTRAQSICDRLNAGDWCRQRFLKLQEIRMQPSYSTAKILWYKENLPEVYAKIVQDSYSPTAIHCIPVLQNAVHPG